MVLKQVKVQRMMKTKMKYLNYHKKKLNKDKKENPFQLKCTGLIILKEITLPK